MPRAAGCSPAARRPARTTERDGKWLQDRIVRRLLLPGRRAVRRVRSTRRAGWTGMSGAHGLIDCAPAAVSGKCCLEGGFRLCRGPEERRRRLWPAIRSPPCVYLICLDHFVRPQGNLRDRGGGRRLVS